LAGAPTFGAFSTVRPVRPTEAWAVSRGLCWIAGVSAVLVVGTNAPHDPLRLTTPFGDLGNKLVAPAARWDAAWFLWIADHGYVIPRATQFYPLYPLAARVVGTPFGSSLVGGVVVSLAGLLAGLVLLERLVRLELGELAARRTTLLLAFFPTAVFFSAVYSEGLFLGLSIGAFYAARLGRWSWAGLAAGLATLARPTGFLLIVPLIVLYLYGPRPGEASRDPERRSRPRHRLRPDALWALAVPAAFAGYAAYAGDRFNDAFVLLRQGAAWHLGFTFPLVTVVRATGRAASGAAQLVHGHAPRNVYEFAFFLLATAGAIGALRRLPLAYGSYAAAGVLFLLCFPVGGASLRSFSRYMSPFFPILMWIALWAGERRVYRPLLAAFAMLMVVNAARFATWHFVA